MFGFGYLGQFLRHIVVNGDDVRALFEIDLELCFGHLIQVIAEITRLEELYQFIERTEFWHRFICEHTVCIRISQALRA